MPGSFESSIPTFGNLQNYKIGHVLSSGLIELDGLSPDQIVVELGNYRHFEAFIIGLSFYDANEAAVDPIDPTAVTVTFAVQHELLDGIWEGVENGVLDLTADNYTLPFQGPADRVRVIDVAAMDGVNSIVYAALRVWPRLTPIQNGR